MQRTVLDPFSTQAKTIVKKAPPLDQLPEEVFETARKKLDWAVDEKRPPKSLLSLESETDVLSWYLLFFTVGTNFTQYSNEARLTDDAFSSIIKARIDAMVNDMGERALWHMSDRLDITEGYLDEDGLRVGDIFIDRRDLFAERSILGTGKKTGVMGAGAADIALDERTPRFGIPWKSLIPLVSMKKKKLTDYYIQGCMALVNPLDIVDVYTGLVAADAVKHMDKLRAEASHVKTPRTDDLARFVSSVAEDKSAKMPAITLGKAGKLKAEAFPPCIQAVINGVGSGSRNFAITVFLTSFVSYARVAPEKAEDPRMADYIKDQKVVDEIMPVIYGAAEKCSPPFFEDQPLERLNVVYHLGLGMNEEPRLENSGSSKWYFPPNCDKVRLEAPLLCKPDGLCKRIKNPLNYYFIMIKDAGDDDGEEKGKEAEEK